MARGRQNVYEGIVQEFKALIASGALRVGERLPSVRTLALERGVNPNTVERAYVELEGQGYVVIYPKKGAYVLERHKKASEAIVETVEAWKASGVVQEELQAIIAEVYREE